MAIDIKAEILEALEAFRPTLERSMRDAIVEEVPRLRAAGDPDELLGIHAAADFLDTTPGALRKQASRGTCLVAPIKRDGRQQLRWRRGDLIAAGVNRGAR